MGYRVFPDANRIGRPKAVTSIPILLGLYRQLPNCINLLIANLYKLITKTAIFPASHVNTSELLKLIAGKFIPKEIFILFIIVMHKTMVGKLMYIPTDDNKITL